MESLWRCTGSETAHRVARADGPMRCGGPEPGGQAWHPRLQHCLPGRFRQLAVEEGHPVGDAASIPQGRLPVSRRDRVTGLWVLLEATLIPFQPREHRVGATKGEKGLGCHRAMVGVPTDQIWASAMQDVEDFVDRRKHAPCSFLRRWRVSYTDTESYF